MGNRHSVKVVRDLPKRQKCVSSFLKKTADRYMEFNQRFYHTELKKKLQDSLLAYDEFQNQPVLFHCMATCGLNVLPFAEHGYSQKHYTGKGRSARRRPFDSDNYRLDYWVLLPDDEILLLIEHKHRRIRVTKQPSRLETKPYCDVGKVKDAWTSNEEKLSTLRKNKGAWNFLTMKKEFPHLKCLTVNLVVVPVFEEYRDEPKPIKPKEFHKWISQVQKELGAKSKQDWIASGYDILPPREEGKSNEGCEGYDGVYFFARLSKLRR